MLISNVYTVIVIVGIHCFWLIFDDDDGLQTEETHFSQNLLQVFVLSLFVQFIQFFCLVVLLFHLDLLRVIYNKC